MGKNGKKSSLLVIFLIVLIDLIGFGIVIPILPYYAQQFGASGFGIGWLMTSYSLMQFLVAPLWGRLSDRIGRRPVLLVSMLGSAFSLTLMGSAHSLMILFLARILAGTCGANISTAYAYISDITTEENRAKGMGMIGAAFGLGFIFGPVIGGLLSPHGYGVPMYVAAGIAALNFILASVVLGEPLKDPAQRAANRSRKVSFEIVRDVLNQPRTGIPVMLFFLFTLAVTQMEVVFAIFLKHEYGFGPKRAGMLLAMVGLIMAFIQGGAIGKLSKRFGEIRLISGGTWVLALGLLGLGLSTTLPWTIASLVIMALGHGVLHPSLSSLTSLGADSRARGATMGVFHSASSLARVVGPPTAGWLFDHVQVRAPFVCATVLVLIVFFLLSAKKSALSDSTA